MGNVQPCLVGLNSLVQRRLLSSSLQRQQCLVFFPRTDPTVIDHLQGMVLQLLWSSPDVCGCTRGPIRTVHEQNCNQKAVKNGFKNRWLAWWSPCWGSHYARAGDASLINKGQKEVDCAGGSRRLGRSLWYGDAGGPTQQQFFFPDRSFFSLKTPRLLLPLCCLSTLSLVVHLCPS